MAVFWRQAMRLMAGLVLALGLAFALVQAGPQAATAIQALLAAVGLAALGLAAAGRLAFRSAVPAGEPLAQTVADGLLLTAADGSAVSHNAAYAELTRHTGGVPGIERLFAGQGSAGLFGLLAAAKSGATARAELPLSLGQSGVRWFDVSVAGAPGGRRLWHFRDTTEAHQGTALIDARLSEAESVLAQMPAGLALVDASGRIVRTNATLAGWIGVGTAPEALSGLIDGLAAQMLADGMERRLETMLHRADGATFPAQVIAGRTGAVAENRRIVLFLDRPLAETSGVISGHFSRLPRVVDGAPIAIASIDAEGRVQAFNAAFRQFFGSAKRQLFADLIAPDRRAAVLRALAAAAGGDATPAPLDVVAVPAGRAGQLFVAPVPDSPGFAFVYCVDASERRALEEQVFQSQKMHAVGQLAGGIAHDFNNVLTTIISGADMLRQNLLPSDPAHPDLTTIRNSAVSAAGLVRQLLAFSRQQTLLPKAISLTDVLEDMQPMLRQGLDERVEARIVHGRDLWPVMVDPTQLNQVVMNLVVNARDAMPTGGRLTLATCNMTAGEVAALNLPDLEPGDYVQMEVADTGTGMAPEIAAKIFEPFFTTKDVGKGTGLGLSTVDGIVRQTGGIITVESAPGHGTAFRVLLPRYEGEMPAAPPPAPRTSRDLTGSATILIVEDEDSVRSVTARSLTSRGYRVLVAESGAQALEIWSAEGSSIDLVISDVVMPEMDGPTLIRRLRAVKPDLSVILISGYADEAYRAGLDIGGRFAFLPKPYGLKAIAEAVKEALSVA